jgi:hypothetical protein
MSQEGKKMPLSQVAKLTGVNAPTLRAAARKGRLQAELKYTPTGLPYYETTIEAVEAWKNDPTAHLGTNTPLPKNPR